MNKSKTQIPLSWTEHMSVIMASDRKCILRGREKGARPKLCLIDEKSRYKIRLWKITKNITSLIDYRYITVTPAVQKLYNLPNSSYNKEIIGELIGVKLDVTYTEHTEK